MAPLVHPARTATHGAALIFETVGTEAPARLRESEDTLLRVIDGTLRLDAAGREAVCLGPGDEAIIAAGTSHQLAAIRGEARCVLGFRPAR